MVAFTQHRFTIPINGRDNWFKMLDRFFRGAKSTIINEDNITGEISYEWLVENTKNMMNCPIVLETGRIFNNWALAESLPHNSPIVREQLKAYITPVTDNSSCGDDGVPESIKNHQDDVNQIIDDYVQTTKNIITGSEGKFYDIGGTVKYRIPIDPKYLPNVVAQLCAIGVDTDNILVQHVYYLYQTIWLISVKDTKNKPETIYAIYPSGVQWFYGPIFDPDDGFSNGDFLGMNEVVLEQLNEMFHQWRETFDQTNGNNWNDEVLHFSGN